MRHPASWLQVLRATRTPFLAAAVVAALVAGASAASAAPRASAALPSSMAALGDSLTRAFGAGGSSNDFPQGSWSTGTDAVVSSHYLRLQALNPAITGNAFNDAVSGSTMAATYAQAGTAISQQAGYVTIWSGTNDACTDTTAQMTSVSTFTSLLQSTLSRLTTNLPGVQILVLSVPDWFGFWQSLHGNSAATSAWTSFARCQDLLGAGATTADRQAVQTRIAQYNQAIATVCAQFAGCGTDGGAVFRLWSTLTTSDLAFDFFHLSEAGQAKVAAAAWNAGLFSVPTNSALPAITGVAQQAQVLSASTGTWSGQPTSYDYQWQDCDSGGASCQPIAGAPDSASYTLQAGDIGHTIRVAVTATNGTGPSTPAVSPATAVVTAASGIPTNQTAPTVSGTPQQGRTLTATNGTWTGSPTSFAYQWQDCDGAGANCAGIGGATAQTYLLQPADVGHTVRVAVTATNGSGTSSPAVSSPTATVGSGSTTSKTFGNTTAGSSFVGAGQGYKFGSIFALADTATLIDFKWFARGGTAAQKLTPVIYTVDGSGNPAALMVVGAEVTVAANQPAGWVTSTLPPTTLSPGNYLLGLTSGPQSGGAANARLTSGTGYYNADPYGAPTATWGATNTETATWSFYVDYTTPTSGSPPSNTALPVVTGTAQQGQTLQTTNGTWTNSPTSFAYQWQDCDTAGANCTAIAGATGQTYLLQAADVGHTIRAVVTASNGAGPSSPAPSAATATVTSGTTTSKTFGNTTAGSSFVGAGQGFKFGSIFTLADNATLVDFKWFTRGGTAAQKFTPVIYSVDGSGNPAALMAVGAEVSVAAGQAAGWVTSALPASTLPPGSYLLGLTSGPQSGGAANAKLTSGTGYYNANTYGAPTATWGATNTETATWSFYVDYTTSAGGSPPVNTVLPAISGTAQQGQTLQTTNGTWTNSPTSFGYQWQDCDSGGAGCTPIGGATAPSYVLQSGDVGHTIRVAVTATNGAGPSNPAISAATATVTAAASLPVNTAPPAVTGTAQQGQTLQTSNGTWTNSPTSFGYQWQDCDAAGANCTAITGAASQTYLLQAADVGHTIRAVVTATNGAGTSSPAPSAATAVVSSGSTTSKTFGNTTAGSSFVRPGAGYTFGSIFTLADSATLTDFQWFTQGGAAAQRFTPVIYATDGSGNPTTLLATGAEITVAAGQASGWVVSALPAAVLPPGQYFLGLTSGPQSGGAANAKANSGTGIYTPSTYGSPPASFGSFSTETATWSFYVDYTTAG